MKYTSSFKFWKLLKNNGFKRFNFNSNFFKKIFLVILVEFCIPDYILLLGLKKMATSLVIRIQKENIFIRSNNVSLI